MPERKCDYTQDEGSRRTCPNRFYYSYHERDLCSRCPKANERYFGPHQKADFFDSMARDIQIEQILDRRARDR